MAKIVVYSKAWCPFCVRAKSLFKKYQVAFDEIDIGQHPERRAEMIERSGGRTTVPQIWIDQLHVGGCDELLALHRQEKLAALLNA